MLLDIGMTPFLDVSPTVGLIPTTEFMRDGPVIEVSVSVPRAKGTIFAETATADPELEPTATISFYNNRVHHSTDMDCLIDRKGYELGLVVVSSQ